MDKMSFAISQEYIGAQIAKRRKELGLTQNDLSYATGFSQPEISRFESGKHEPELGSLVKFAVALNVSIDWLLGLDKERH